MTVPAAIGCAVLLAVGSLALGCAAAVVVARAGDHVLTWLGVSREAPRCVMCGRAEAHPRQMTWGRVDA